MNNEHLSRITIVTHGSNEVIDQIQQAMNHTKKNGDINWEDGDEIDVNLAGTFAADRFIVIVNRTKSRTICSRRTRYWYWPCNVTWNTFSS